MIITIVLLREIEYFKGILIMTTNRVTTFDIAMLSRIHWPINFGDLTTEAEIEIWEIWFEKWKTHNTDLLKDRNSGITRRQVDDEYSQAQGFLKQLRKRRGKSASLNGREIRNIFITSRTRADGGFVKFEYIDDCYNNIKNFREEMQSVRLQGEGRLLADSSKKIN